MNRWHLAWLLPALALPIGCQAIAGLDVPTYRASSSASTGGGGGASSSTTTTATGTGGGGGGGGINPVIGNNKPCATSPKGLPPCLEHIHLWLRGDTTDDLEGKNGKYTAWKDASNDGWIAKGAMTFDGNVHHHPGVLVENGLALRQPDVGKGFVPLYLEGVSIFAAVKDVTLPDQTTPNASSVMLCLGSDEFSKHLTYADSETMYGERFSMQVGDTNAYDQISMSQPRPDTNVWHIYVGEYLCGPGCATSQNPAAGRFAQVDKLSGWTSKDTMSMWPSLGNDSGFTGRWETSMVGSDCTPGGNLMNGYVGEIIVYDQFLEDPLRTDVYSYMAGRWYDAEN